VPAGTEECGKEPLTPLWQRALDRPAPILVDGVGSEQVVLEVPAEILLLAVGERRGEELGRRGRRRGGDVPLVMQGDGYLSVALADDQVVGHGGTRSRIDDRARSGRTG
jgi:hypothetical protein